MGTVEANAAGIDVGARKVYAAVPPDRDPQPVRSFDTFTEDLEKLAHWLLACGIRSVAMESTGVYSIPGSTSWRPRDCACAWSMPVM